MKRGEYNRASSGHLTSTFSATIVPGRGEGGRLRAMFLSAFVFLHITLATAITTGESPYSAIVGRNAFALKPPLVPAPLTPPTPTAPKITLQGISTILGRAQVLLKVKIDPRPPEAAKELSLVMDVGQREGEVEVLEIDPTGGIVKLNNQGSPLTLNMQDNADKPQPGPAITSPIPPPVAGVNPVNPAAAAIGGTAAGSGSSAGNFNGGSGGSPGSTALPTRNMRANPNGVSQQNIPNNPNSVDNLPLEAKFALIEVERERTKEAVKAGKMPPIPQLVFPKK